MTDIFMEARFLTELKGILREFLPSVQVLAYGSRVDGTAHSGSDLDIAVVGDVEISKLKSALEKSSLPFLIDVVKFDTLPDGFKQEVMKCCVRLL